MNLFLSRRIERDVATKGLMDGFLPLEALLIGSQETLIGLYQRQVRSKHINIYIYISNIMFFGVYKLPGPSMAKTTQPKRRAYEFEAKTRSMLWYLVEELAASFPQ